MTKKTKKIILWTVIALVVIAIAVGAYFWMKKKSESEDAEDIVDEEADTTIQTKTATVQAPRPTPITQIAQNTKEAIITATKVATPVSTDAKIAKIANA